MENDFKPKQRTEAKPQNVPLASDVFYANGISIDINPSELVLTFDRFIPGTEPEAKTIILNSNSLYSLSAGLENLVEQHNESLEKMKETGYYGESSSNRSE